MHTFCITRLHVSEQLSPFVCKTPPISCQV